MTTNKPKKANGGRRKQLFWPLAMAAAGVFLLALVAITIFNRPSKPGAAIEVSGAPSLKVDQEKVDLGEVKLGQTVQVSFELTNVGDQALKFNEVPYIEVLEGC